MFFFLWEMFFSLGFVNMGPRGSKTFENAKKILLQIVAKRFQTSSDLHFQLSSQSRGNVTFDTPNNSSEVCLPIYALSGGSCSL